MYLFLDDRGCVTTRDKAVKVVFGLPDWVAEDIAEYGTKYCCGYGGSGSRTDKWGYVGYVRCEGMGGTRSFSVDAFPCIDGDRRAFVLNRDSIFNVKLPLVCLRRNPGGRFNYDLILDRYNDLIEIAKKSRCRGHCVLDVYGSVVAFGDDVFDVVDEWVKLMRSKIVSEVSVLV